MPPPVILPGIYPDVPAESYHADPALSSSGARKLIPPSCPAKFQADREAGNLPTRRMEFGTAAHTRHLGIGPKACEIKADDWRSPKRRQEADEARAAGMIPLLTKDLAKMEAMTAALAKHRTAARLFAEGSGLPERSLWWQDREFGIMRRARLDWLPHGANGLVIIPDYKTTGDASPEAMRRTLARFAYHCQGAWYGAAVQALRPGVETRFVLVAQETDPPYLVACYRLEGRALDEGRYRNRRACEIFRDCTASGVWPGYDPFDGITALSLPGYAYTMEDY